MSSLYVKCEVQVRALFAIALCLAPLAFSPGCGPTPVACFGTGVTSPTAAVSIDLGDLLKPEASATLHVGDELYVQMVVVITVYPQARASPPRW